MANAITSTGITTLTQAELLAQLTASMKTIYGADINLDSSSPDGQMLNIFIQATVDSLELVTNTYNSMNPDNCVGVTLDQRVALNGLVRIGGTYTVTPITIVTSQACNLYGLDQSLQDIYTVSDLAGNSWQLQNTATIGSAGTQSLIFQAQYPGAVTTVLNTITTPVTIVLGVSSINNPSTYTILGLDEESDSQLRLRRLKSVSLVSTGYQASLLASLRNISGVTDAYVYENNTGTIDADSIPGHSIWVITAGSGTSALIAEAIYSKRNAGCGMKGSITHTITQLDGTFFNVAWDAVTTQPLFIKLNLLSIDGVSAPNINLIQSNLPINYVPGVYKDVNINALSTQVQSIDSNSMVDSGGFCSTSASGAFVNLLYPTAKNYQFQITAPNIVILPMILQSASGTLTVTGGIVYSAVTKTRTFTELLTGLGGYGTLTYSVYTNVSGGSVGSTSGIYTAGGSVGTDIVRVTDSLGNIASITITVV